MKVPKVNCSNSIKNISDFNLCKTIRDCVISNKESNEKLEEIDSKLFEIRKSLKSISIKQGDLNQYKLNPS